MEAAGGGGEGGLAFGGFLFAGEEVENHAHNGQYKRGDADPAEHNPRRGHPAPADALRLATDFAAREVAEHQRQDRADPVKPQDAQHQAGDGKAAGLRVRGRGRGYGALRKRKLRAAVTAVARIVLVFLAAVPAIFHTASRAPLPDWRAVDVSGAVDVGADHTGLIGEEPALTRGANSGRNCSDGEGVSAAVAICVTRGVGEGIAALAAGDKHGVD